MSELFHPLPEGTVFSAAGGRVTKVVVDARQSVSFEARYTVFTNSAGYSGVRNATSEDLDECVENLGWEVSYVPEVDS